MGTLTNVPTVGIFFGSRVLLLLNRWPMPRYFFPIFHKNSKPDCEGVELPDRNTAWDQATKPAGEVLKDIDGHLEIGEEWRLEEDAWNGSSRLDEPASTLADRLEAVLILSLKA